MPALRLLARAARWGARPGQLSDADDLAARAWLGDLAAHVKGCLADYKAPRNLVLVESVGRAPNGKVDYKTTKARAAAELGIDA